MPDAHYDRAMAHLSNAIAAAAAHNDTTADAVQAYLDADVTTKGEEAAE